LWENKLEWVKHSCAVKLLLSFVFNEDSNERVHALVLLLFLLFVDVKLLSKEAVPVALKLCLSSFADHFSFHLDRVIAISSNKGRETRTCWLSSEERSWRHSHLLSWHVRIRSQSHTLWFVNCIWHSNSVLLVDLVSTGSNHRAGFLGTGLLISANVLCSLEVIEIYLSAFFGLLVPLVYRILEQHSL